MASHSNLLQRKGYLRLFQFISSFAGLVLMLAAIAFHRTDTFQVYEAGLPSLLSLTTFCWTLAWSLSAILLLRFDTYYPAGVDVGLDFIGLGLGWGFGIWLIMWAAEMNYPDGCEWRNTSNTFCINTRALMACEIVGGCMAVLYGACHLLLLVMACRSLHFNRLLEQRKQMAGGELEDDVRLGSQT